MMSTLTGHIFGCLFWGFCAAALLSGLSMLIASGISGKRANPLFLIILLPCLMWQSVLFVGATYARSYITDIEGYVESIETLNSDLDIEDAAQMVKRQFPQIPDKFIENISSETVQSGADVAKAAARGFKDSLDSYMWKRVMWTAIFMVAGTAVMAMFPADGRRRGRGSRGHHRVPQRSRYFEDLE